MPQVGTPALDNLTYLKGESSISGEMMNFDKLQPMTGGRPMDHSATPAYEVSSSDAGKPTEFLPRQLAGNHLRQSAAAKNANWRDTHSPPASQALTRTASGHFADRVHLHQSSSEPLENLSDMLDRLQTMSAQELNEITPDNPLFFIKFVRFNKLLRQDLKTLDQHEMRNGFINIVSDTIKQGRWSDQKGLSSTHPFNPEEFKEKFSDIKPCPKLEDVLFLSYYYGKITRAEFHTAYRLIKVYQQSDKNIKLQYISKKNIPPIELPKVEGVVTVHRLFTKEGYVTPQGMSYINNISRSTAIDSSKLLDEFKKSPENLQVFFEVSGIKSLLTKGSTKDLGNWFNEFFHNDLDPLIGTSALSSFFGKYVRSNPNRFSVPSYGLIDNYLSILANSRLLYSLGSKHVVEPVMCLGIVNPNTLAHLHATGWHPVATLDPRLQSNLVRPHGNLSTQFFIEAHDLGHARWATMIPTDVIKILCEEIPGSIHHLIAQHPETKELGEKIIEELSDLNFTIGQHDTEINGREEKSHFNSVADLLEFSIKSAVCDHYILGDTTYQELVNAYNERDNDPDAFSGPYISEEKWQQIAKMIDVLQPWIRNQNLKNELNILLCDR